MADTITLTWGKKKYFITPAKVMRARQAVEAVYSLKDLITHTQNNDPHFSGLSMAYGALLRSVGANVDDEEIYDAMFEGDQSLGGKVSAELIKILIPQVVRVTEDGSQENPTPTPPSKNSSKSRSAKNG